MKVWIVGLFGFVLHVTVTACNDSGHKSLSRSDSGMDLFNSRDAEFIDEDADDTAVSDGEAQIPLIITPQSPSLASCTSPYAPVLEAVPMGELLPVFANPNDGLSVGTGTVDSTLPDVWIAATDVNLPADPSDLTGFAQLSATACPAALEFMQKYSVRASFAPAAGQAGSTAISKDDTRFQAWATQVLAINYGVNVTAEWQTPDKALGPATDDTTDVVSLGEVYDPYPTSGSAGFDLEAVGLLNVAP